MPAGAAAYDWINPETGDRGRVDAAFAREQRSSPPDHQPPPPQHLKLQTDAILDGLILKLEPR